jgi:hypothetical protein
LFFLTQIFYGDNLKKKINFDKKLLYSLFRNNQQLI